METLNSPTIRPRPWNKGGMTGHKAPLKLREIWAIRTRLVSIQTGAIRAIISGVITPIRDTRNAA